MTDEPLWKVQDVATHYRVSSRTVLNWIARGIVRPHLHVGSVIRFRRDELAQDLLAASGEVIVGARIKPPPSS